MLANFVQSAEFLLLLGQSIVLYADVVLNGMTTTVLGLTTASVSTTTTRS